MPTRRALLIFLILLTLRMTAREGETPLLPARPAAPMPGGEPPASPPTTFRVYLPLVARQGSERRTPRAFQFFESWVLLG
jgi:hypothetical protein